MLAASRQLDPTAINSLVHFQRRVIVSAVVHVVLTVFQRHQCQGCVDRWTIAESSHVDADTERLDYQSLVATSVQTLPKAEREVVILFYFAGRTLPEIARSLRIKEGTAGKRLHSARLRMRRKLPNSVRTDFVRVFPSTDFVARVRRGLLDEYVGEYRFDERADQIVRISREGDLLVSTAVDQRHVLVPDGESVTTQYYDGEGRFRRNRRGEVTGFVYYEFGKRLGIARKIPAA